MSTTSPIPTNLAPSPSNPKPAPPPSSVPPTDPSASNPSASNPAATSPEGGGVWWNTAAPTLPVPTYTGTLPPSGSSSSGVPIAAVAGGVAGGCVLLILLGVLLFLYYRRRRNTHSPTSALGEKGKHGPRRGKRGKHHSLGSRSSFGFTIRPGAIPPSLRAEPLSPSGPYGLDPAPPTSSSLAPAYGLSFTPTSSGSGQGTPTTATSATGTGAGGDSVLDRLFTSLTRSGSARTRTEDSHAATSDEQHHHHHHVPLPSPLGRPMMRPVERERPMTGSTGTAAESTRPLVASLYRHASSSALAGASAAAAAGRREKTQAQAQEQDAQSEKSAQTFYTVPSLPPSNGSLRSGSIVFPENASGVSLAPLSQLPRFPVPPRWEEESEAVRREYGVRLGERRERKERERRSAAGLAVAGSAGEGQTGAAERGYGASWLGGSLGGAGDGRGLYALAAATTSVTSLSDAPHPPTPLPSSSDDLDPAAASSSGAEADYSSLTLPSSSLVVGKEEAEARMSQLTVVPRVVEGDAPVGGEHEWVADLDVRRTPTPTPTPTRTAPLASAIAGQGRGGVGAGYADPFASEMDDLSLRDLELEMSSSSSLPPPPPAHTLPSHPLPSPPSFSPPAAEHPAESAPAPAPPHAPWLVTAEKDYSIKDDGQSERYRELERERGVAMLLQALGPGAGERVRSLVPDSIRSSLLPREAGRSGSGSGSGVGMRASAVSAVGLPYLRDSVSSPLPRPEDASSPLPGSGSVRGSTSTAQRKPKERRSAVDVAKSFRGSTSTSAFSDPAVGGGPPPSAFPGAPAGAAGAGGSGSKVGQGKLKKVGRPRR